MADPRPSRRGKATRRVRWSDGGAFGVVPEWVLRADVKPTAKLLYAFLALYAGAEDATFRGKSGLADDLASSTKTIDRAMAELVAIGAVTVVEREGENGARLANGYVVHVSPRSALASSPPDADDGGAHPADDGGSRARGGPDPVERDPLRSPGSGDEGGSAPPKRHLVDGRDLGFDALARECGVDPRGPRAREVASALYGGAAVTGPGIRALVWEHVLSDEGREQSLRDGAVFERIVADSVRSRAAAYRRRFRDATLTPLALAKWFLDLNYDPPRSGVPAADAYRGDRPSEPEPSPEERAENAQRAREALDRLRKGSDDDPDQ